MTARSGGPLWETAFFENEIFEKNETLEKNTIFGKLENPDSWEFPPSNMDPSLLSALLGLM